VALAAVDRTMATAHSNGGVALRDMSSGWSVNRVWNNGRYTMAVAFSPDGRLVALGGAEPGIVLCDVGTEGATVPLNIPVRNVKALAISPDGQTLVAGSSLTAQIILWDLAERRQRSTLHGHSSPVLALAFAPDGRSLASGNRNDQTIIVWDVAVGHPSWRLEAGPGPVRSLAYSPDGPRLASANYFEPWVRL
jgi:WD40 repeat protein